jgi:DNA-binding ferritin-like protein
MLLPTLLNLWADLRAAHHLYWTLHWQARGPSFYGDHSLFAGLYQEKAGQIDALAEIIAAHYGSDKLDPIKAWEAALPKVQQLVEGGSAVAIAEYVIQCCENANEAVLESGECPYPAGLSNFVSDLSTKNIKDLYMLKQRFGAK